ncbi:PucR family transcriptional regulator [Bailinhaonella thermotolerans]|nr:helix-turn-helix domain-containing protein [Bailinhaonella thermotolerans]
MQETVDEAARVTGAPATLEDRAFNLLASSAQDREIDSVRQESILRRRASPEVRAYFEGFGIGTAEHPVRVPPNPGLSVLGRLCVPVRRAGVTYGYLWLLDDAGEIDENRLLPLRPAIDRVALLLAQEARARQDRGRRLRDLISPSPDVREAAEDLVPAGAEVTLIAVTPAATPIWTPPHGVIADTSETPYAVLAPSPQAGRVARELLEAYGVRDRAASPPGRALAGIGSAAHREDAWRSWRHAVLSLRVATAVPGMGPVASWPDLGVYRPLSRLSRSELRDLAADPPAYLLLAEGDRDLIRTVETYLDKAGHAQETATALNIHRQTLYYRLSKAARVTGLNLANGEDRLLLHLSLKARHLLTD